ncbi:MAG: hypothetical protein ACI4VF_06505 [Lachnospirales bacterium]
MMEIYILPDRLDNSADKCRDMANRVAHIKREFRSLANSLDWDIRGKANIAKYINTLNSQLSVAESTFKKHHNYLIETKNTYLAAEGNEKIDSNNLKNGLYKNGKNNIDFRVNINSNNDEKESEFIKFLHSIFDPIASIDSNAYKFFSYFFKYIPGIGGLIKPVIGWGGSISSLVNKYKNGVTSWPGFMYDMVKYDFKMFTSWGDSVLKFDSKIFKKIASDKFSYSSYGTFGKICKYAPVVNVGFSFFGTAYDSYKKYSADGSMDFGDWSELLIDSSVDGLVAVGEGLLTIVNPFVGISFGTAAGAMDLSGHTSKAIKDWASSLGKHIGQYRVNGKISWGALLYDDFSVGANAVETGLEKVWDNFTKPKNSIEDCTTIFTSLWK